jgi:hydroxyacyl-ACP dehydratase HTD2-like protein with hotdog domain
MISLFMFSAAIWAVHRIHWDTPYAQFEGLPLPVVPGWMVSCYFAQLAEMKAAAGQRLKRLSVRYKGMVHPGDTLTCTAAQNDDGGISLSMTNQGDHEVAQGEATYADR